MENELVLVTGGSGFIACHIIIKLLNEGYKVRATLRNITRQDEVKEMITYSGIKDITNLEFIEADLMNDKNWLEAMKNVTYVMHVASPTPVTRPKDDNETIKMAVDGVKRVMEAAVQANVKRVVLTSASGAVISGHKNHPNIFTEKDWTDLSANIDVYQRSKTMAEKEAWKIANDKKMELTTINPVAVMGPVLGMDYSHSNQIIRLMLNGKMPKLLKISFDYVDVRDVADLHLLAMTKENAKQERFIATSNENLSYRDEALVLKDNLGEMAKKVSTKEIPNFLVKILALFRRDLRMPATFLGQNTACSNEKAKELLGWKPRSAKEAILSTATSMINLGLVEDIENNIKKSN